MVENIIIMAGGAGTRLWPASIGKRPKQFMRLDGKKTLFRKALERAFQLGIDGKVIVVTHKNHVEALMEECRDVEPQYRSRLIILAEPAARNTAPALALAAARMQMDGREKERVLVMASDHLISPFDTFKLCVETASREAASGFMVLYGIVPGGPATGYGYIEAGEGSGDLFPVLSFREKPGKDTAESYVSSGRYFWNSGMLTYRPDVFTAELALHAPGVAEVFSSPAELWFSLREDDGVLIYEPSEILEGLYSSCPSISVDYAVMEKSRSIRVIKACFSWNDVGSWDVISELDGPNAQPVYSIGSQGNFVYSDVPVALCGVEDLIVVAANNRILVCRKGMSQLVKDAAEADLNAQP